ncbi:thiol reductant ABC exporter subunit CydC [Roseiflexus sp.]|uniref:thiol reductant ABC exporter subunit CydC n=1 Tax=Roseiflexus sp. TaxID=2562120 RepID=UPI00398B8E8E
MNTRQVLSRLLTILSPLWGMMTISIAARVLNFLCGASLLAFGVYAVSRLLVDDSLPFEVVIGGLATLSLLKGFFRYVEQYTGHYVAFRLLARLRFLFYTALEPQVPAVLARLRSGDVVSRMSADVDRIEPFYAHTIAPFFTAVIAPVVVLIVLCFIHPAFALTVFPFLLLVGLAIPWWVQRINRQPSMQSRVAAGHVNALLTDSLQGLRDTLAFNDGERRKQVLRRAGEVLKEAQSKLGQIGAIQNGIVEMLIVSGTFAVLGIGVFLFEASSVSLTDLAVATALSWMAFQPLSGVTGVINDFSVAMTSAARVFELMDLPPAVRDPVVKQPFPSGRLDITFESVSFAYPGSPGDLAETAQSNGRASPTRSTHGQQAVQDVSFIIPFGWKVALVGESGAGKSTLIALLLRFWDPDAGRILINGTDIRQFSLEDLRAHIAVVSQQTYIFNTSIRENIRLGRPGASETEVIQAAKRAHLHDFILSLPHGYDTQVGEMGNRLSGGQRQRLALARAFLKDAPILVLDEATANLDPETEQDIQLALRDAMTGRTVIIVAHRLSALRDVGEALVFEHGRLVERGVHETLLARSGVYARLFTTQQDVFDEFRLRGGGFHDISRTKHLSET